MRLWHIDLIPYLPTAQLKAQWRELNSIYKKQDNHLLINYNYDYPKYFLKTYSIVVLGEMQKRNYKFDVTKYSKYFEDENYPDYYLKEDIPYLIDSYLNGYDVIHDNKFKEHNNEYLTICYWNLREKYIRKQKDFTEDVWLKLDKYYKDTVYNSYPKELKKILSRKDFELLFKGLIKGE